MTFNKKYAIIITVNKERKMIMEETKTTKIRLYSEEDYVDDTLAWFALTDEQLRLLNYLSDNGYLADGINYEEYGEPNFTTI